MTTLTLDPTALPADVIARLGTLAPEDRSRALRLLAVAERCCGGDATVLSAIVDAVAGRAPLPR